MVGACTSSLDFSTLFISVHFFHLLPVIGSSLGVILGASCNFFLNRWLAFRSKDPDVGRQAIKFTLGTGLTLALHALTIWTLTGHLRVNYMLSKLIADLLVFTGGNLLVNRYLVFTQHTKTQHSP